MTRPNVSADGVALILGLNTREAALALWLAALLVFVLTKRDVWNSFGSLLKLILGSTSLSGVIASAVAYVVGIVLLLKDFGYWQNTMVVVAAIWFLGVGVVAVFNTKRTGAGYFRHLLLDNLAVVAVVEFVVNLHTFALPVELVLAPLLFLLVGIQAVSDSSAEYRSAGRVVAAILALLGLASLSFSLDYVVSHFEEVVTFERAKDFVLPLILTSCFLPYLYAVRMFVVWQTMLHMIRAGMHGNDTLYRFSRRAIIRACGVSLGRAQLFAERFRGRLWGVTDEAEVTRVVERFRRFWDRRHVVSGGVR